MATKEKYINPFTDFGFKKLFGSEYNKELLIDFLNQVLGERERIQDLTYLNTENQGKTEWDRKAVFDLYCENERGEKFIIELQNVSQLYFKDRSIFYASFPIQEQAPKGKDWDYYLKAVYTICILNFSFPDQSSRERYLREIQLIDKDTFEAFYEKLTFIYLEMPKFRKGEGELVTHFDKWMYVLKNLPKLQARPAKLQEKIFDRLFSQAEIAKLTPDDMRTYEESLKTYRDNYSIIETAKYDTKVEIAKEMKKEGDPIEKIARITGLSKEQIEKL
ncbi:Rpn family recombination-promoting nuclease/putative transposase [Rhodocytophaga aerolata]|uniref:Rpn family recombination-promoting nuclease/putative transposase n=1 Tax=Rhodocytophaga aerolata TaxID=455078 RepID=A0ABT8RKE5_9BACT|nr:Rpn family recombination-promoting nuclease/putative transposase [Rhodocytophaga aerolata]MDO1451347.1 Rpn family recombination-promoting nuclease/putative transposase [Rhodocytophaga aerolata]